MAVRKRELRAVSAWDPIHLIVKPFGDGLLITCDACEIAGMVCDFTVSTIGDHIEAHPLQR